MIRLLVCLLGEARTALGRHTNEYCATVVSLISNVIDNYEYTSGVCTSIVFIVVLQVVLHHGSISSNQSIPKMGNKV